MLAIVELHQLVQFINDKGGMAMYAVKVLHGYIGRDGQRTRDKKSVRIFQTKNYAKKFADKIGGRVKELD